MRGENRLLMSGNCGKETNSETPKKSNALTYEGHMQRSCARSRKRGEAEQILVTIDHVEIFCGGGEGAHHCCVNGARAVRPISVCLGAHVPAENVAEHKVAERKVAESKSDR